MFALVYCVVASFEAIGIGWVAAALVPGIEGGVLYSSLGAEVRAGSLALGLAGMAVLTLLNYRGARAATRLQDALIYGFLALAASFIVAGIVRGDAANLRPLFQRSETGSVWPGFLAIFMTASFWFAGFEVVPKAMEEKAPGTGLRAAGRMIVLSIVVGIAFKTLVVLSASMAMPWRQLVGVDLPAAAAFERAFDSPLLANAVLVAALFALLSTWNAMVVGGSRILFSFGRARMTRPRRCCSSARRAPSACCSAGAPSSRSSTSRRRASRSPTSSPASASSACAARAPTSSARTAFPAACR
jgi:amino acid transporter